MRLNDRARGAPPNTQKQTTKAPSPPHSTPSSCRPAVPLLSLGLDQIRGRLGVVVKDLGDWHVAQQKHQRHHDARAVFPVDAMHHEREVTCKVLQDSRPRGGNSTQKTPPKTRVNTPAAAPQQGTGLWAGLGKTPPQNIAKFRNCSAEGVHRTSRAPIQPPHPQK